MATSLYRARPGAGFGKQGGKAAAATQRRGSTATKPLKRPSQARAKFTVQAIYDALVRIWRREGWAGVTTRAVALETGISVGTLYDYFPNKQALLSGYVRHCVEALLQAIEQQVIHPAELDWGERMDRLVRLSCGVDVPEQPYFDAEMLALEAQIAEPKHHRRAFEELSAQWQRAIAACTDLPSPPDAGTVSALFACVWGGRRYLLMVQPRDVDLHAWVSRVQHICRAALGPPGGN
ncbi:TetR/AcrR family transcriptional regulator [Aquabacterium sp. A7-Y]|uniref:TetR/AcrR family transcriptional regulator n=1 Tax=Aquabacterium sp. A7-Y TaxID=1349605 RepID=UPI00223E54FE|nr:TetR/AcrR family transcriptional regulator [Aquabacterium sp. A7-Y]MCW7537273.1 TetR/AcrR family transcriptional regulator [Aquabacterium sp. A7-Y]